MAGKIGGMGWTTFSVDNAAGSAKDIRNDITNFSMTTPRGVQDVTGLDKFAIERLVLLADLTYELAGVMNPDADRAHAVLSSASSSSAQRTVTNTVAAQTMAAEVLPTDYAVTRAADASLTWTCPMVLANGAVPTWA